MAERCQLGNCGADVVGTQRVVRDIHYYASRSHCRGRIVVRRGEVVSLCASCFDWLVTAHDDERRREMAKGMRSGRGPVEEEDYLGWSVEGRMWSLHASSRIDEHGPHHSPGFDGLLPTMDGGLRAAYFLAWRQGEAANCARCRCALKRRRVTIGNTTAPFTLAIGVFRTPGPADPDPALHRELPYALLCEGCARQLYEESERRLDALDPPEEE